MEKKVVWITSGIEQQDGGEYFSSLASNRYRLLAFRELLQRRGYRIVIADMIHSSDDELESLARLKPHLVVVGKTFPSAKSTSGELIGTKVLRIVDTLRQNGARVGLDFNDDHFDRKEVFDFYRRLLAPGASLVASTETMVELLAQRFSLPAHLIGDPFLAPREAPRRYRGKEKGQGMLSGVLNKWLKQPRLRLAWFGNATNWSAFADLLPQLAAFSDRVPLLIRVVCAPSRGIEQTLREWNQAHHGDMLIEFVPWSEEDTWLTLSDSHVVVLPADNVEASVKSPNRLIDSIRCGCFVVGTPIKSYLSFKDYCWLGENIIDGLSWYLAHPEEAQEKVSVAQGVLDTSCSPERISEAWAAFFETVLVSPQPNIVLPKSSSSLERLGAIKLNLGCGDKILDGYVNVDVVASRKGRSPDVISDIKDLQVFEDGYADQVLAVHVIEHFWRWEVLAVLTEWMRVLKPGGELILECPNLRAACEVFLKSPDAGSQADARGQRTMWVFYGDPAWQDPLMIHRWGYTPDSLAAVMAEAGFVDIHQAPAQFKLREPRDMRMVGTKPLAR